MKRTIEYTLLIIGAVFSLIGIVFAFVIKFVSKTPEFKSEFKTSFNEEIQGTQDIPSSLSADQVLNSFAGFTNYALVILVISILLTIVAIIFVKKQRILSGVLAIVAGLVSILIMNFISFLLLIVAGIMLLVRKNKTNNQFEDVNFQNDLNNNQNNFESNDNNRNNFESNEKQVNNLDETDKKKKDDDPYIY
ncbi:MULTISPECIES: DUF4064 domain-containing protein [Mammaliicoccus]|uniref:DUF4064 domain-containing protein n=1 Tax=Mammaliicoccus TaxID=2803850 RepID=UPI0009934120|nr:MULTISPECIES: DUF4064 domain-containing protein [Mammaliicoccus]MBO3062991.1 DUF4064 domain-containing protein [Mammaliicoccus fleurettii]MEB7723632.1 DUF4064 domain-containing protein [Mammaliicoccus fleurettii]MEB7779172.1 DUF4064 domain-containing protein [Mammaliicoccus fleurettii]MEB8067636.1 DUF4064 domain-containing protein [Mammaliicoccus fleurettii]OOV78099.1 hypothetical protein B2G86_03800 [Mammaliicoccus fleurettii]